MASSKSSEHKKNQQAGAHKNPENINGTAGFSRFFIVVRQVESVVDGSLAPAGAFIGAAFGAGAGVARDVCTAVGA
jgi:hypothetical protein